MLPRRRRALLSAILLLGLAGPAAGASSPAPAPLSGAAQNPPQSPPPASAAAPAAAAPAPALLAPLSAGSPPELPALDPAVPSPAAFLGYPLGTRFTHWDRITAYLDALAAASPRVKVWDYGSTYEGRPLKLLAVTSPQNLARLDQLRRERLRLADPGDLSREEREQLAERLPIVVWLAYGVHGNESSSAEAAMAVAYLLAAGQGEFARQLERTIVLIDPLSNPDGRERYVSSYEQRRGQDPNPRAAAAEHSEPWPGGRQNHYLLDLNRDWAWASQKETRARLAAYRDWEPQVYVDFHEMGSDSSYFFPPPAEPVNPLIDRRIVSWLDTFGRANAAAFDRQGWVYFKGESYDLFYPGYGDTYPSLRGAVGMTYEMAGGGRGGLALTLADGSTLTLADRVVRHLTTSLTTVRTAAANPTRLLADFAASRDPARNGAAKSYLWPAAPPEARTLADLLALHGIRVRQLAEPETLKVRRLARAGGTEEERRFEAGSYMVTTAQPLGTLAAALMETETAMPASFLERQRQRLEQNLGPEFYDITAWSLPLAFNFDAWVTPGVPEPTRDLAPAAAGVSGDSRLGVLVKPQGLATFRLTAALQRRGVRHRVAQTRFAVNGTPYPSGTVFIPRHGNPDFEAVLADLIAPLGLTAQGVASSYEFAGLSPGSQDMTPVKPVRAGLVGGEGVDPTSFGFLWYLLDGEIGVPHDRLDLARLGQMDLGDFDVLVLPEGDYEDRIPARAREALDAWVKSGGVLVAVGEAVEWLEEHKMTAIKRWEPPKVSDDPESGEEEGSVAGAGAGEAAAESSGPQLEGVAERPIFTPGAALATHMQADSPLTLGLESPPAVLVEGTRVLRATGDPQKDVLVAVDEHPVVAGFAFPEAEERLAGALLVGRETRGRGTVVVFAQDPAFRLFWRGTTPILLNVLLYGPSVGLGGR
jgi:zinc carboxypeptidase